MANSCCLACKYWKFKPPASWKPESPYRTTADVFIRETQSVASGQCTFNPIWVPTQANHYCGRFQAEVYRPYENEVFGTWKEWERDDAVAELRKVKLQLKKSREISASRLRRLKQQKTRNPLDDNPTPG